MLLVQRSSQLSGSVCYKYMTQDSQRFLDEIEAFGLHDKIHPPPISPVLFYGSSSIVLWETAEADFPDWTILRRGFGGSTLEECVHWCDRLVIRYSPCRILVYAGDNDLANGASPDDVFHHFKSLVQQVQHALGPVPIYYISIKPSPARWNLLPRILHTNQLMQSLVPHHKHVHYIDVAGYMLHPDGKPKVELYVDDGLHLSPAGYSLWAKRVHEETDF